jgi:structural maintenance of chromosome 1
MLGQLRELNKSKPRSKGDENLVAEITRLESTLTLARDDLVRSMAFHMRAWFSHLRAQASLNSRLKGVQDEMKHLNLELKRGAPELKQVCYLSDTRC